MPRYYEMFYGEHTVYHKKKVLSPNYNLIYSFFRAQEKDECNLITHSLFPCPEYFELKKIRISYPNFLQGVYCTFSYRGRVVLEIEEGTSGIEISPEFLIETQQHFNFMLYAKNPSGAIGFFITVYFDGVLYTPNPKEGFTSKKVQL